MMKRPLLKILLLVLALFSSLSLWAQRPLYVVNGEPREEIHSIPPEIIERIESLPADEESIARYGEAASHGVILVTLTYDCPASFSEGDFEEWIAARVDWDEEEPVARVVVRYEITAEGRALWGEVLEATDNRLLRRVRKAFEESPAWQPATKMGEPVGSTKLLNLTLPEGRKIAPERYVVLW